MQDKRLLITGENIYKDPKTGNIFLHSLLGYSNMERRLCWIYKKYF
jgi:hypothetical protein